MAGMQALYAANDDDYDYDTYGNPVVPAYEEDDYYNEEEERVEDAVESVLPVTITSNIHKGKGKATQISDVPDEVYFDDTSLANCWSAALLDFQFAHPARFPVSREAPRTAQDKYAHAPLWYGNGPTAKPKPKDSSIFTVGNPATNNLPSTSSAARSPATTKKKKKKRSKRKSAPTSLPLTEGPPPKRARADSPAWTPISPTMQPAPSPPLSSQSQLPNPSHFVPPPLSLPPHASTSFVERSYPTPPPIVPLEDGDILELANEAENDDPEELMQKALWSWYNAGYQTGLYHAAIGAAASKTAAST